MSFPPAQVPNLFEDQERSVPNLFEPEEAPPKPEEKKKEPTFLEKVAASPWGKFSESVLGMSPPQTYTKESAAAANKYASKEDWITRNLEKLPLGIGERYKNLRLAEQNKRKEGDVVPGPITGTPGWNIPAIRNKANELADYLDKNVSGGGGPSSMYRSLGTGALRLLGGAASEGVVLPEAPPSLSKLKPFLPEESPLGLPPAPAEVENAPRFLAGPQGIVETGKTYPIEMPGVPEKAGIENFGTPDEVRPTVLPHETGSISQLPPEMAARTGTSLGQIPRLESDEQTVQDVLGQLDSLSKGSPMEMPKPKTVRTQVSSMGKKKVYEDRAPLEGYYQSETPPTPLEEKEKLDKIYGEVPKDSATSSGVSENTTAPAKPSGKPNPNFVPYRPIPENVSAKSAIKQWADGQAGATYRGKIIEDKFSNLNDPALIDAYEKGDRSGILKAVQKFFDDRWEQAKGLGFLAEDQKRLNYLRHYFEQSPEEVGEALKTWVKKNPNFAKKGKFPTYLAAREAGITPKYETLPEIMGAYEAEFNKAIRNKELYDWLQKTGRLNAGAVSSDMASWKIKGPDSDEVRELIDNVLSRSKGVLGGTADLASLSKNIYLGGGIPYTKYNRHAWNILSNDISNRGFGPALKTFFSDPTGNKAVQWMKNLPDSEKQILADLVDRGWQGKPMEDVGSKVNLPQRLADKIDTSGAKLTDESGSVATDLPKVIAKGALKGAGKLIEGSQNLFEKPLFEKSLPALSSQRVLEAYHSLIQKGMAREDALKYAAQIGNDFYGGVDKVLRSATNRDLGRIAFLAPDWLESQVTKAIHQWKGAAKSVVGKANPAEQMYGKSLLRSAVTPSLGVVGGIVAGKKLLSEKNRDIAAMPIGTTPSGKQREVPTLTTANEEFRIPIIAPIETMKGNPVALKDILIKNRISQPANTAMNLLRGQDQYGRPLVDPKGNLGKGALNYLKEASSPFQHQMVQALIGWLNGSISAEEAAAQGLELPISYSKPPRQRLEPVTSMPRAPRQ